MNVAWGWVEDSWDWTKEAAVNVAVTPLAGLYALGGGINNRKSVV